MQKRRDSGRQAGRWRLLALIPLASIMLTVACGTVSVPTAPTVQAAATMVAPTIAAAQAEIAPTIAAAQTELLPTVEAAQSEIAATMEVVASAVAPLVEERATEVMATVEAVQSEIAPTREAAASAIASAVGPTVEALEPTIAALQTQVAPTVAAIASEVAATIGPPVATAVAASPVEISDIQINAEDTTVTIRSRGTESVNLSWWVLGMGSFPLILPSSTFMRLDPNETLTLHFARGDDSETDVYLGQAPERLIESLEPGTLFILLDRQLALHSYYRLP